MRTDRDEAEIEASRAPLLDHLIELRRRLFYGVIAFFVGFIVCYVFAQQLYGFLAQPLYHALEGQPNQRLIATSPQETFVTYLQLSAWGGLCISFPVLATQLWLFVAPGLYKRERRVGLAFAFFSGVFFISGALFCYYFVLGNLYSYLLEYGIKDKLVPQLNMAEYFDLTKDMMLAFGGVFELPLLIFFLAMVGLVTHRSLWKFNRWFIVLAFIIGAILTPSPDVVSQIMMALPMIALYNISILLAWQVTAKREKADAALKEKERLADEQERAAIKAKQAARAAEVEGEGDDDE